MAPLTRRTLLQGAAAAPLLAQTSGGPLNVIHIGVDTWATHWLGCYGNPGVRTPNVDKFAEKCVRFADVYPEVLPTIPCRRSLYTGRRIFPSDLILQRDDQVRIRGWHQLYAEDVTLSEVLRQSGYTTAIVSDLYHQFKPDKNFHRGFASWRWIRGQESDRLESGPSSAIALANYLHASQMSQPPAAHNPPPGPTGVLQYLLNRRDWKSEDDWLAAQVFREAGRWLENNLEDSQPFYLHIESFSPHEFWDPPEDYYRLYMKSAYRGPRLINPPLTTARMSPVEVEHARALYGGLVSFVDDRIGRFLAKVESLGLMKNTLIVFIADHGTMMGEQGQLHKAETRLRTQVTHVPFLLYHPRKTWAGRTVNGFVEHTDLMPTLLDLLQVKTPARVTGQSLVSLIESGEPARRDTAITGWGEHGAVRTPEWLYIGRWSEGQAFEELYDVRADPGELKNIADQRPAVTKEYRQKLKHHVDSGWAVTRGTFAAKLST